jgi:hypothetical protein
LRELSLAVDKGLQCYAIAREPHSVLLQREFYAAELQLPAAKWALVWLLQQPEIAFGVSHAIAKGNGITRESVVHCLLEYLTKPAVHVETGVADVAADAFSVAGRFVSLYFTGVDSAEPVAIKLLNLVRSWVMQLLPHCWRKVHRVAFGLLRPSDPQRPNESLGRRLLAVPFVGKDAPRFIFFFSFFFLPGGSSFLLFSVTAKRPSLRIRMFYLG